MQLVFEGFDPNYQVLVTCMSVYCVGSAVYITYNKTFEIQLREFKNCNEYNALFCIFLG